MRSINCPCPRCNMMMKRDFPGEAPIVVNRWNTMCDNCRKAECKKELSLRWLRQKSDQLLGLKLEEEDHAERLVEKLSR